MGSIIVSPHITSDPLYRGDMRLGPMTNVRSTGGKVRVGYVDVLGGPVRHRMVSIAPAFDPDAISMTPVPGWRVGDLYIPGSRLYRTDLDGNPIGKAA